VSGAAEPGALGAGAGPRDATTGPGLAGLSAVQVATVLGLLPHREGGFFRETYRSPVTVTTLVGTRSLSTAILYLLTEDDPSRFHRLRFDEVWFFHAGSPVEMVFLDPLQTVTIGPGTPQVLAPGGRWMGARIAGAGVAGERLPSPECSPDRVLGADPGAGPAWALIGCVVSPGFEYDDFEAGERDELSRTHPQAGDYLGALS
jgi:uncharacterized protein